jgi:hypothetical protein
MAGRRKRVATGSPLLNVSSKLLENYRSELPILGQGAFSVTATADGPVIAVIGSTSATSRGYAIVRSPAASSGWQAVSLGTANLVGKVMAVTDSAGTPHIFASDGSSLLHAAKTGAGPGDWSKLEPVPGVASTLGFDVLVNGSKMHILSVADRTISYGTQGEQGSFVWSPNVIGMPPGWPFFEMYLLPDRDDGITAAVAYSGQYPACYYYRLVDGNWSAEDVGILIDDHGLVKGSAVYRAMSGFSAVFVELETELNAGWNEVGFDASAIVGNGDSVDLAALRLWVSPFTQRVSGAVLCFQMQPFGGPGAVYVMEALADPPVVESWSFAPLPGREQGVVPLPAGSTSYGDFPRSRFDVLADSVGETVVLFALDTQSNIAVAEQSADGWTPLIPLGQKASGFAVIRNAADPQVLARGPDGLFIMSKDPETSEWTREDVLVDVENEVHAYNCYSVEVTATDSDGAPLARIAGSLKASASVIVRVNGKGLALEAGTPVDISANGVGVFTIELAIPGLNSPELFISVDGMERGAWVSISPQQEVQPKIKAATVGFETLRAQTDRFGNYVVKGEIRDQPFALEQVALGLQRCCEIAQTAGTHLSSFDGPLRQNRFPDRVRYVPPGEIRTGRHLNLAKVPAVSWSLDFSSGGPVYKELTPEEAAAILPEGLFGVSWGDIWDGIKSGAAQLKNLVVRVIVDPVTKLVTAIEAQVTALVEGALQVFRGAVGLLEQAFDVIEGIFAKIKAFLTELINWLSFFFDWNDILRTKSAIKYNIQQSIVLMDSVLLYGETQLPAGLRRLASELKQYFQSIKSDIAQQSVNGYKAAHPLPAPFVDGQSHNIVLSNYMDGIGSGEVKPSVARAHDARVSALADSILEQLTALETAVPNQPGFTQARDYVASLAQGTNQDADTLLTTTLVTILEQLVDLLSSGLALLASAVEKLFQAIRAVLRLLSSVLEEPIYVPLVSDLYEWLTGDELTAIELMSLLVAVPVTLVYKIIHNAAPFDNAQELAAFEARNSAAAILPRTGLPDPIGRAVPSSIPAADDAADTKVIAIICAVATILGGVVGSYADWSIKPGKNPIPENNDISKSISQAALFLEVVAWGTSCPWVGPNRISSAPGFTTADGLTGASWVVGAAGPVIDGVLVWKDGRKKSLWNQAGWALDLGVGVVNLGFVIAVAAVSKHEDKYDQEAKLACAAGVLGNLPSVCKFLLPIKHPYAKLALAAIDLLAPFAAAPMAYDAATYQPLDPPRSLDGHRAPRSG